MRTRSALNPEKVFSYAGVYCSFSVFQMLSRNTPFVVTKRGDTCVTQALRVMSKQPTAPFPAALTGMEGDAIERRMVFF